MVASKQALIILIFMYLQLACALVNIRRMLNSIFGRGFAFINLSGLSSLSTKLLEIAGVFRLLD